MWWRYFRHGWVQLTVAAYVLVTVALGCIGLRRQYPGLLPLEYAIRTSLLFSLYGVGEPDKSARLLDPYLLLARLLAAIFVLVAGTAVIRRLLGEHWVIIRLRFFTRRHVIVCGLGAKGRCLAAKLRARGRRIVAIETNAQPDNIAAARRSGTLLLRGDATDDYLLECANLRHARALVAFSGSDRTNVEIAALCATLASRHRRAVPLRCAVHLTSPRTRELLQQSGLFPPGGHCEMHFFNVDELTARLFLRTALPAADVLLHSGPVRPHLIVIGFGALGESLAARFAHLAHYPRGGKPRVTVVTPAALASERCWLARYPFFRVACEVEFIECDLAPAAFGALPVFTGPVPVDEERHVVVAGEEDVANLLTALELRRACPDLNAPIHLRIREADGWQRLTSARARLVPFGQLEKVCTGEIVLGEQLDDLARAIHERYCQQAAANQAPTGTPSLPGWGHLDEDLREACRWQADHHGIKLGAIGARIVPLSEGEKPGFEFAGHELEMLGRTEHHRWCAERHLAGWSHGPTRDPDRKTHPLLVPWEALDAHGRAKCRDVIEHLPALLKSVRQQIVRAEPSALLAPEISAGGTARHP